jgi:hypothetical protein
MQKLRRMWVNQPSTLQPDHECHGKNVLVIEKDGKIVGDEHGVITVWFTGGATVSQRMFVSSLSNGWR